MRRTRILLTALMGLSVLPLFASRADALFFGFAFNFRPPPAAALPGIVCWVPGQMAPPCLGCQQACNAASNAAQSAVTAANEADRIVAALEERDKILALLKDGFGKIAPTVGEALSQLNEITERAPSALEPLGGLQGEPKKILDAALAAAKGGANALKALAEQTQQKEEDLLTVK